MNFYSPIYELYSWVFLDVEKWKKKKRKQYI